MRARSLGVNSCPSCAAIVRCTARTSRFHTQVAKALHNAHKHGLIHRDVKPDNILITLDGQAKLADLGLVKEVDADLNLTKTGRGLGTPHFMAPEQFRNAKNADPRCDIYSLGATMYMLVTGKVPFESNGPLETWMRKIHNQLVAPRQLVPELSEHVDRAILRAMRPNPDQRPATCREFVEDLAGTNTTSSSRSSMSLKPPVSEWSAVRMPSPMSSHGSKIIPPSAKPRRVVSPGSSPSITFPKPSSAHKESPTPVDWMWWGLFALVSLGSSGIAWYFFFGR